MNAFDTKHVCVEYRTLDRFPGYRFGSDGTVWTCWKRYAVKKGFPVLKRQTENWVQMTPCKSSKGRLIVILSQAISNKRTFVQVHRAVLEAFKRPPNPGEECCHNDGNPLNNDISNLRWDTRSANQLDRHKHGTALTGRNHPRPTRKYTEEIVSAVRKLHRDGVPQVMIASRFQIPKSTVNVIIKRGAWAWMQ
jgi:hypothetical protein